MYMQIINLGNRAYLYYFQSEDTVFPCNISVFRDKESALIIDLGYQECAERVRRDLISKGVKNFNILISHHHEDHFDGCKSFSDSNVYASGQFGEDHQTHLEGDEFLKSFTPDFALIDGQSYTIGQFHVKCYKTPGHNKCGFSFLVNEKYLHIGDLMFSDKEGIPSIPYIDQNSTVKEYINSMELIRSLLPKTLLLGHGYPLFDEQIIEQRISDHLYYLGKIQKAQSAQSAQPVEKFLRRERSDYSGLKFHVSNLENV